MKCLRQSSSDPTKYALLIGINYLGSKHELSGCINDVQNMKKLLIERLDYPTENVTLLTDDPKVSGPRRPTRFNILKLMRQHIKKTKNGDTLFIHFSGHGAWRWETQKNGQDEKDHHDELICAIDKKISDDTLYKILVKKLPTGVRLRCIFDSCHSGSVMDLPCRLNASGTIYFENNNTSQQDIVMISGCRDSKTSSDAWIAGRYSGALTWAFIQATERLFKLFPGSNQFQWDWSHFIGMVRYYLHRKSFLQVPQCNYMYCGKEKELISF